MTNQEKNSSMKISENTMKISFFRLNPECYIINGKVKSLIYNLLTGDVIPIDANLLKFLQLCECNMPIIDAVQDSKITLIKALDFLQQLEKKALGTYYARQVYIDKYRDRPSKKVIDFLRDSVSLQYAFLELTNKCSLNCFFCNENMNGQREVCMGCSRKHLENGKKLALIDWKKILIQLRDMNCAILILTGGDPLLFESDFNEFIRLVNSLNFHYVFLITNGTNLSEENISMMKKYSIHPIIQIFSHDKNTHESITGSEGSFDKQIHIMEKLCAADLKFSLSLIVLYENQNNIDETKAFFQQFLPQNFFLNMFYPARNNSDHVPVKFIDKLFLTKDDIPRTSLKDFFHKQEYNSCLFGKIAVTCNGEIIPCIGMRNEVIGNATEDLLSDLFQKGKFDKYWELSRDKVNRCKECEFRYACNDCRLIEMNATGSLFDKKFCTYDPSIGCWSKISFII